jgi:hypothetical protein
MFKRQVMVQISCSRVLVRLKTIDSEIHKKIENQEFVTLKKGNDKIDVNAFKSDVKQRYQSLNDLITRRSQLKYALLKSNAITVVKVDEIEYTIAEVIDIKNNLYYKKELLEKMRNNQRDVEMKFTAGNESVQQKLDKILEIEFGNKGKDNNSNIETISKSFREANKIEYIDPLDLKKEIEKLDNFITNFESEADLILSESNALTLVNVKD